MQNALHDALGVELREPLPAPPASVHVKKETLPHSSGFGVSIDCVEGATSASFANVQGGAPASTCPRFLWWCRNAEDESRLLNYTVNGIVVFAAGFAALSEVGSYHAAFVNAYHLRGILDPFHPMWQAFAKFVEANPVVTQVRGLMLGGLPYLRVS